ncbi:prepilin-type N-terminal cleavage/methylation domain-containing protein [Aestuariibaculum sp. M13]|uniref:prepilin-type N-terminal cleavage/methylation domain-containing protein n=1 Tax=unclassified Aestuariibaculum TaxID=2646735 RepID=UPI00215A0880|nr:MULTISPECIES: prepilin-type N-terminal cleavage/methylation domain-containing protein [unclassified Aestuariibaculum]MCR8667515.1 prepilin-type N-terminal cleavage/methylation domain-containing protein [Aestuariibaculum sp. M13]WMI65249.1 prepilin-type N-terminal cleavage/methylation domain-containing protein [Aestuariibaculum sp. YM273]
MIKKINGFTLNELVIVLIITSIVVGLAFSILSIVQRHMSAIQKNIIHHTQLDKLEQRLWMDFNRFSTITYDKDNELLIFINELDTLNYEFLDKHVVIGSDSLQIEIKEVNLFFLGHSVDSGNVDALKLEMTEGFQSQQLFVYKHNDAAIFMNNGI